MAVLLWLGISPVSNDLPVFNIEDRVINSIAGRGIDEKIISWKKRGVAPNPKNHRSGRHRRLWSQSSFSLERDPHPTASVHPQLELASGSPTRPLFRASDHSEGKSQICKNAVRRVDGDNGRRRIWL